MINEASNTTAQKAYGLTHFKTLLTEAGKAPFEQRIAEYLFNCTHGLNKQHYQPAVLLQYLSNAKEYISAQWSNHPFWTAAVEANPRCWYSRLRKKLKKYCSNR